MKYMGQAIGGTIGEATEGRHLQGHCRIIGETTDYRKPLKKLKNRGSHGGRSHWERHLGNH